MTADPTRFKSAEEAYAALGQLQADVRSVKEKATTIDELRGSYDKMSGELAEVRQALAHFQAKSNTVVMGESERGMRRYVEPTSGKVRLFSTPVKSAEGVVVDWEPGLCDDLTTECEAQRALQSAITKRSIIRAAMGLQRHERSPRSDALVLRAFNRLPDEIKRGLPSHIQKAFTDSAGVGAEWIPDQDVPDLIRAVDEGAVVRGLFRSYPMATKTVVLPYQGKGFRPYIAGQASSNDPAAYSASDPVTSNRTLTAVSLVTRGVVDEDSSEDSLWGAVDALLIPDMAMAARDGIEDAMINGDTGTHQDAIASWAVAGTRWAGTNGASEDHRRAWIGLRAAAFDKSNATDRASTTSALILQLIASLGPGFRRKDVGVFIANEENLFFELMALAEFITVEKYGAQATVVTGELGRMFGRRVVTSPFMTADLAATGLYTGSGSKASLLYVDTSRFLIGDRLKGRMSIHAEPHKGIKHLVLKDRVGFLDQDNPTTDKNVGCSINLAIS